MAPQLAPPEIRDAIHKIQRRFASHVAVRMLDSETQA